MQETFAADELQQGYLAAIPAPEDKVKPESLWIVNDQLRQGTGLGAAQNQPFDKYDHMLFHIEIFDERDDWDKLKAINEAFQAARKALNKAKGDKKKIKEAEKILGEAILQAKLSADLTRDDQNRVVRRLREQFESDKKDFQIAGLVGEDVTLAAMMKYAPSVADSRKAAKVPIKEILKVLRSREGLNPVR
jgi:hypothetical protein